MHAQYRIGYRGALCARFVGVATRVSHVCQPAVVGSRGERGISGRYRGCTSSHRGVLHTYRRFGSAAWHEVSEIPRKLKGRREKGGCICVCARARGALLAWRKASLHPRVIFHKRR